MVFSQNVPHHGGALLVRPVRSQTQLVHGEQDTPVDRLQPVSNIRQSPLDDDAHGVVQEGLFHLLLNEAGEDPFSLLGRGHSFTSLGWGAVLGGDSPPPALMPRGAASSSQNRGAVARWAGGKKETADPFGVRGGDGRVEDGLRLEGRLERYWLKRETKIARRSGRTP